jgi:predicted RND superfamily exporter protein
VTARDHIEVGFERWGHFVFRHARATIAAVLALSLGLASQLPKLRVDGSDEAFLRETDPARQTFDSYREQFGRDAVILIAIQTPEVFDLEFLARLRATSRA